MKPWTEVVPRQDQKRFFLTRLTYSTMEVNWKLLYENYSPKQHTAFAVVLLLSGHFQGLPKICQLIARNHTESRRELGHRFHIVTSQKNYVSNQTCSQEEAADTQSVSIIEARMSLPPQDESSSSACGSAVSPEGEKHHTARAYYPLFLLLAMRTVYSPADVSSIGVIIKGLSACVLFLLVNSLEKTQTHTVLREDKMKR